MYKRILLALDLEGVNYVIGEPYMGLTRGSSQWYIARNQAVLEINAAAEALLDAGAEHVAVWDNHGDGSNIDPLALDPRIEYLNPDLTLPRMYFAENRFDCICYFGYHTMEGTLGGVLAHTMSSKCVQFYKLNGQYIGEIDIDAYIAAEYGMASRFFAGGNLSCLQARRAVERIVTVETKQELARNDAIFRDNQALLGEIKHKIVEAVNCADTPRRLSFPATMEKSFKRTEDAAIYLTTLHSRGIQADYLNDAILGKDAHTVISTIYSIDDLRKCI